MLLLISFSIPLIATENPEHYYISCVVQGMWTNWKLFGKIRDEMPHRQIMWRLVTCRLFLTPFLFTVSRHRSCAFCTFSQRQFGPCIWNRRREQQRYGRISTLQKEAPDGPLREPPNSQNSPCISSSLPTQRVQPHPTVYRHWRPTR